tara:strand:+ start:519 stop:737 length:219 start_codon:yes stop_codon:yes gene_type:complete
MPRSIEEIEEEIEAAKILYKQIEEELSDYQADLECLEAERAETFEKVKKAARLLQITEARLHTLDIEKQCSG